jgi:glucoamylase
VVTSPANGATVSTPTVKVTGTTSPGASVTAEGWGAFGGRAATASATANSSGDWSLTLPTNFGSTTITVTATSGDSTGYAQLSVTNEVTLPGTTVFATTDPTGDDNGPGTYQYPTNPAFQPGAFDLTAMQVNKTATDVYLQVTIANLADTFGAAFGAQLLDVYVHNPSATSTSTAAAFATRNYTIAPADAWSERIEAQGFASPVWLNASGASLGSAQLIVNPTAGPGTAGTATLVLPSAAFGPVGSGWVFTVTLTGQDGFSPDLARAFTATPGAYTFGVCAPGGTSPICSVDPTTVPKVMDTFTPPGVSQSTELDPTLGPVVLQGVTVP